MPESRIIKTRLAHKDEWFKMLAVAESLKLPILFIGPPGTGKTNTLLDYAQAKFNSHVEAVAHSFIIEVDEGTKSNEIKGRMDIEAIVTKQKYEVLAPIVNAKYVLINEVDKASSSFRNSMLSCMNERILFTGNKQIPLQWDIWSASCNSIPDDEVKSPFWDRFALKVPVGRLSKSQITTALTHTQGINYDDKAIHDVHINVFSQDEIQAVKISERSLGLFIDATYTYLSDRTLVHAPNIMKAIKLVYGMSESQAVVKTCELLTNVTIAKSLAANIEPKEVLAIREAIEQLQSVVETSVLQNKTTQVKNSLLAAKKNGIVDEELFRSLVRDLEASLAANKYTQANIKRVDPEVYSDGVDTAFPA